MVGDDQAATRAAYDEVAQVYANHFRGTEPEQPMDLAMIDHFVAGLPDASAVLDGGCGAGRMSRYLADRGCRVQGVDLSPGMIEMGARDHPDIPTRVGSLTDLPFERGSFDALFYWYSVIHVSDVDLPALLTEACRVLRPGGSLLLAFQTGQGTHTVGEGYRRFGLDVTMVRYHRSVDEVSRLMASHGLTETARMERAATGTGERGGQAVVIGRNSDRAS